jgi:uncharacterized membrane protein YkoI
VTTVDPAPAPAPLTVDGATAIAVSASPGRVIDVDAENGADDPTEATDQSEPTDPTEPPEPSGPWFDVTVLHDDGTATKVAVDATTGRVVSTETEPNGD